MYKILLVDDQDVVRDDIKAIILEMNINIGAIYEASDGIMALEAARSCRPDIIIADIKMPGLDGLEFIERLKEENIESHIVIVTAYDDFAYAKKAINFKVEDYLVKPVMKKDLASVLMSVINSINRDRDRQLKIKNNENQYLDMLLFEYLTGKDIFINIEKLLDGLELEIAFPAAVVAVADVENKEADYVSSLKILVNEYMTLYKHKSYVFFNGSDRLIFIVMFRNIPDGKFINEFRESLKKWFVSGSWGVSDLMEGINSLRELYRQADAALKEGIYKGECIYFFHDIKKEDSFFISNNTCAEILGLMAGKMKRELEHALFDLFARITKESYTLSEVKGSLLKLVNYIYLNLPEDRGRGYDIEKARKLLFDCQKIFSIKICLKKIIDEMYELFGLCNEDANPDNTVDYLLKYVKSNFHREISLTQAANELSMNYSYLSSLFTQKAGMTFSQYLQHIRLEKAKMLLLSSVDRIHEIAEKCGYCNPKYFCRVFKEQTGKTPGEYKMLYSKKY